MKKSVIIALIVITALSVIGTSVTYALLADVSSPVVNTFTYGRINIELLESSGTEYLMIPGVSHSKDPRIIVKKGSESCWLFCRLKKTADFDQYMEYEVDGSWTLLEGSDDVYWREVESVERDTAFYILEDNLVHIKDSVTEEQLAKLDTELELKILAYAMQRTGVDSPEEAWKNIEGLQG